MSAISKPDGSSARRRSLQLTDRLMRARRAALFDDWVAASFEAQKALEAWWTSATVERARTYARYCDALDREERAAMLLASATGSAG